MGRRKGAIDVGNSRDVEDGDGFVVAIEKTGNNSRRIRLEVIVSASLQVVWEVLTDYERLPDFIPSLAVSRLVEKRENFTRVFQAYPKIGEQKLAFGLKFSAKATIDCFEKDLEVLPSDQKRDIEFKMVEGDFQCFEGKWSVVEQVQHGCFLTMLVYIVNVKPKVWRPVHLVEGRLTKQAKTDLSCLHQEAEKAFRLGLPPQISSFGALSEHQPNFKCGPDETPVL